MVGTPSVPCFSPTSHSLLSCAPVSPSTCSFNTRVQRRFMFTVLTISSAWDVLPPTLCPAGSVPTHLSLPQEGLSWSMHDLLVFVLPLSHSTQFSWVTVFVTICNCITVVIDGEGNGTPLQHSCLENPMGGGAWCSAIYQVAQSRTRLKQLSSGNSHMLLVAVWIGACFEKQYVISWQEPQNNSILIQWFYCTFLRNYKLQSRTRRKCSIGCLSYKKNVVHLKGMRSWFEFPWK